MKLVNSYRVCENRRYIYRKEVMKFEYRVIVIVCLDKSNDDSIRNEEVNGMGRSTNTG